VTAVLTVKTHTTGIAQISCISSINRIASCIYNWQLSKITQLRRKITNPKWF